jgi:hypothetical protein
MFAIPGSHPTPPRAARASEAATWEAWRALAAGNPRARETFLVELSRWRSLLLYLNIRRGIPLHDAEDAVAEVIAIWCRRVLLGLPLHPPRKGSWLSLLLAQVREQLRPRRLRTATAERFLEPKPISLDALRAVLGDVFPDPRAGSAAAAELAEFIRARGRAVLTPAEFDVLLATLAEPHVEPRPSPSPSARVLAARLRERLKRAVDAA